MPRWSLGFENAGWFDHKAYKRNQGVRVRRFTILGLALLLGSGIYTLVHNSIIGAKDLTVTLPFTQTTDAFGGDQC